MKRLITGACTAALTCAATADALAADPTGTWLTQSGETQVRIAPCGSTYCGTVVWLRNPTTDSKNPDKSKRSRNVVGIQMISGVKQVGENTWQGSLYNYTDGKTYTGKLSMQGDDALKLSGCVLAGLICRSQTWTRVE